MIVRVFKIDNQSRDVVVGNITLKNRKLVPDPREDELLKAIISEPIFVLVGGKMRFVTKNTPETFLRHLPEYYKSSYLRVSEVC